MRPSPIATDPKLPPQSIEAEQAVLGGLMLSEQAWDSISSSVFETDFYRRDHRLIFRALQSLSDEDKPRDYVTVSEWLESRKELENAGGLSYLVRLSMDTPSAANIQAYADIVHERAVLRNLIVVGNEIADSGFHSEGRSSSELLDLAESKVYKIAETGRSASSGFTNLKSILKKAVDRIDLLFESKSPITGIATGFSDFDEKTSGLQNSDLIIVAGRPSMGKTSFAMNMAEHIAMTAEKPAAIFSMEMPGEQLAMRLISSMGRIDLHKLRSGQISDADWPRITSAISLMTQKAKLYIDDTPSLSPTEIRSRTRRLAREYGGLSVIIIDYLQLMQIPGGGENRATEISEISRSLKALAKELNVPVVALSQLNRGLEQRPDKRPVMADLRDSGAIEQDADVIVFIYRDEVYNEDTTDKGTAEILIRKQRNGPTGMVRLTFLGEHTRFEDFSPEIYSRKE